MCTSARARLQFFKESGCYVQRLPSKLTPNTFFPRFSDTPHHQASLDFTLDLPQIAVVGSQSSGKSSVLEALVGRGERKRSRVPKMPFCELFHLNLHNQHQFTCFSTPAARSSNAITRTSLGYPVNSTSTVSYRKQKPTISPQKNLTLAPRPSPQTSSPAAPRFAPGALSSCS